MDGAEIAVLNKENESVIQEIRHFIAGRCWNHGSGQGKRERPTRNQAFYCGTVLKSRFGIRKTGASYKKSGILLRDGAEIAVRDKENGRSYKKSGILLRDGAGIAVLNKENGSVRQEIRHFTVGRC